MVVLVGVAGCAESAARTTAETPPRAVSWTRAAEAGEALSRRLPGRVQSKRRTELAFEVPGRVQRVLVDDGDTVRAGQVLATLEPISFDLAVAEAKARLAEVNALATQARDARERSIKLHARGAETEAGLVRSRAAAARVEGQIALAKAALASARERRSDAVLRAPFAGRIASRRVEPAETIAPGRVVFGLQGEAEGFEIRVPVPETLIERLDLSTTHPALVGPKKLERSATVSQVASEPDGRQAYPVTFALGDSAGLRDGMSAEVRLELPYPSDEAGVEIPSSALHAGEQDTHRVFVINDDKLFETSVEIQELSGDRARVSGLTVDQMIVDRGVAFLRDGQHVRRLGVGPARSEGEGQ